MKKSIAIALALLTLCCLTAALAEDTPTTILTLTVPAATYTMQIPASQTVPYSPDPYSIGAPTITESAGFNGDKAVKLTVAYRDTESEDGYGLFVCPDTDTPIRFFIRQSTKSGSGSSRDVTAGSYYFANMRDGSGTVHEYAGTLTFKLEDMVLYIIDESLNAAKAGTYTAGVLFHAEIADYPY